MEGLLDTSGHPAEGDDSQTPPTWKIVAERDLAAALVVPAGYGQALLVDAPLKLIVFADAATDEGQTTQNEMASPPAG